MVVDGSPAWHVYQSVPLELEEMLLQEAAQRAARPAQLKELPLQSLKESIQERAQPALSLDEVSSPGLPL